MMELFVFGADRALSGIVESYEYLRWTRRYVRCGSFELIAIATPENLALLKEGSILQKPGDDEAGIIERVELTQTDREIIAASGRFATRQMRLLRSGCRVGGLRDASVR